MVEDRKHIPPHVPAQETPVPQAEKKLGKNFDPLLAWGVTQGMDDRKLIIASYMFYVYGMRVARAADEAFEVGITATGDRAVVHVKVSRKVQENPERAVVFKGSFTEIFVEAYQHDYPGTFSLKFTDALPETDEGYLGSFGLTPEELAAVHRSQDMLRSAIESPAWPKVKDRVLGLVWGLAEKTPEEQASVDAQIQQLIRDNS